MCVCTHDSYVIIIIIVHSSWAGIRCRTFFRFILIFFIARLQHRRIACALCVYAVASLFLFSASETHIHIRIGGLINWYILSLSPHLSGLLGAMFSFLLFSFLVLFAFSNIFESSKIVIVAMHWAEIIHCLRSIFEVRENFRVKCETLIHTEWNIA